MLHANLHFGLEILNTCYTCTVARKFWYQLALQRRRASNTRTNHTSAIEAIK